MMSTSLGIELGGRYILFFYMLRKHVLFYDILIFFSLIKSTELTKTEEEEVHKTRGPQYFNPCYNCGETTHAIRDCKMNVNLIAVEWNKGLLMISKFYEQRHFQKG